jgi:ubiquinone/menaquinone biosynthesis C-methylase UbiE
MIDSFVERCFVAAATVGITPPQFPSPLFDAYFGAIASRALIAAACLGIPAALDERPDDPAGIAQRVGVTPEGADLLLSALWSLGYVRMATGRYQLTRRGSHWLGTGGRMQHVTDGLAPWAWQHMGRFEEVLRGAAPGGVHDVDQADPFWPPYQGAMEELAKLQAWAVARRIPTRRPRTLLDLAGGPGVHAAAMCRRHRRLQATIVELETPARLGRRRMERLGMADRIRYVAGDLFETDLGDGYDVVTAHWIVHNLDRERSLELLRRARAATRNGGTVAVLEMEQPAPGRRGTAVSTLNSLAFYSAGGTRNLTRRELREIFREAGLVDIQVRGTIPFFSNVVVAGRRP